MKKENKELRPLIHCPAGLSEPRPLVALCSDCRKCVNRETRILVPPSAAWQGDSLVWDNTVSPLLENWGGEVDKKRVTIPGVSDATKAKISRLIQSGDFTIKLT